MLAPDVFGPDEQGHCVVLVGEVPPDLEAQARAGVANCPEQAISVEDAED
jgi:ferredoxin